MFGRATIRLGIGPHSSCAYFVLLYTSFDCAFVVLGLVFHTNQGIGLGNVSEMTYFVLSATYYHNSVNQTFTCSL